MKIAVFVCLALFAAVCSAAEIKEKSFDIDFLKSLLAQKLKDNAGEKKSGIYGNKKARAALEQLESLNKVSMTKNKKGLSARLVSDCEQADAVVFNYGTKTERGMIFYHDPGNKRSVKDGACTFHIKSDPDTMIVIFAGMMTGSDDQLNCADGGKLDIYEGGDDASEPLYEACDYASFDAVATDNEAFITFTPDTTNNIALVISYGVIDLSFLQGGAGSGSGKAATHKRKHHSHHHRDWSGSGDETPVDGTHETTEQTDETLGTTEELTQPTGEHSGDETETHETTEDGTEEGDTEEGEESSEQEESHHDSSHTESEDDKHAQRKHHKSHQKHKHNLHHRDWSGSGSEDHTALTGEHSGDDTESHETTVDSTEEGDTHEGEESSEQELSHHDSSHTESEDDKHAQHQKTHHKHMHGHHAKRARHSHH